MASTGYSLGDFTADPADEHVVIHAKVGAEGRITREDGTPLPSLSEGALVQLRVRASYLTDKEQRSALSVVEFRELLAQDSTLFAIVDTRSLDIPSSESSLVEAGLLDVLRGARNEARRFAERRSFGMDFSEDREKALKPHEGLLEVRLLEALTMERKGLRTYRLRPCACVVSAFRPLVGRYDYDYSLNHALTRISEQLELHRISHTGNVFSRYLVPEASGNRLRLRRLGTLRDRLAR